MSRFSEKLGELQKRWRFSGVDEMNARDFNITDINKVSKQGSNQPF